MPPRVPQKERFVTPNYLASAETPDEPGALKVIEWAPVSGAAGDLAELALLIWPSSDRPRD